MKVATGDFGKMSNEVITVMTQFDEEKRDGDWCFRKNPEISLSRLLDALNYGKTFSAEIRKSEFTEGLYLGNIYYIDN